MYSVDLNNMAPKGGLTCLFAKATSDESKLWHRRLGHLNFKTMNKLVKGNLVRGLPSKLFENDQTYVACQKGKQHRASSTKDETSGILKSFITRIENLVDHKVKVIRCDNGTEFKNREMNQFCEMKGILRQFSVARTPQQNGVAERRNRTLIKAARTMLADSKLPTTFWAEAVNTACYVQNRVLVVKPHNKTPYELFHGRTPTLSFMRPFGCLVTILNTIDHLGKFNGKADEGFFVGYSLNSKAFRVFNSRTRIVEENLHIRFSESTPNVVGTKASDNAGQARKKTEPVKDYILLPLWTADPPYSQDPKSSHNDGSKPSSDDGKKVDEDPRKESECNDQEKEDNVNSTNNVNVAGTNEVNVVGGKTSIELPFDPNMPALEDYSIFDFSRDDKDDGAVADTNILETTIQVSPILTTRIHKDHPLDQVIGYLQSATQTRKILKNLEEHRNQKGNSCIEESKLDRGYAGRASTIQVTKRYTQEEGIDYDEVFALVARIKAIRLFFDYASFKDFVVYQMDVKSAFLYGKIEEEVYVCQPPGFEDPNFPDRVYKVEKALYGLHQAFRAWYETLLTYLLDNGFQIGKIDNTLFIKRYKGDILLVQVNVDDIIFGSTKMELCITFEKLMHEKFHMSSMGELTFFLGLQVKQKKDGIFISQDKYVDEILKKFGFIEVKTASTPIETQKPLLKDENGEEVDVHMYRSMIGSLMYLTSSRPDIMFSVCACARYQVNPKVSHLHTMKRIFSDYAGANLDRKSTTRGKAKKSVKLMMEKLFRMELELMLVKTINGEAQLHALVDGKKIIVTESSVRRDLQLADEEGVDCLPNSTIFEQLTLMGPKTTAWNEFSSTMASAIIYILQAYIPIAMNIESEPFEDPIKTKETHPLSPRAAPLSPDYTSASPDYTPDTPHSDEDSEPMEGSETRTASPSGSTLPLSPDHPLTQTSPTSTPSRAFYYRSTACMVVRTQPTMSPGISGRVTKAMSLSTSSFRKSYRSSYETPSSSTTPASSPTLPIRKRYGGTSESILDTETEGDELEVKETGSESEASEDEGPSLESKEAALEGQQQQVVSVENTVADETLGLGYRAARRRALELTEDIAHSTYEVGQSSGSVPVQKTVEETTTPRLLVCTTWEDPVDGTIYTDIECVMSPVRAPVQTPALLEWSSGSLPVSLASLNVPSPPVTTLVATIVVDEDKFLEVGAQLELYGSIHHDHTQRLDALPPTFFEGYGSDFTRLFARSEAVRNEIHSQRFRLGSLERAQEQTTITFGALWRPVLTLEA
ncbi:putative ribonuclease H-like domain-containing protein [Tanacetum coccineum]